MDVCEDLTNNILPQKQKGVSVHSCFVTMLHLANEKGLRFSKDEENFLIFKENAV